MSRLKISACRVCIYLALGLLVFELLIVNIAILYLLSLQHDIQTFIDTPGDFLDKVMGTPMFKNMVFNGKSGGFVTLLQNTADRLFLVTEKRGSSSSKDEKLTQFDRSDITYLGVDVSSAGEAVYLIRRLKQRGPEFFKTYKQLVVDIGANDGLMSSNSFNLIQLGWDAILVEPQQSLLMLANDNIKRYANPYNSNKSQQVVLVNAVIGRHDGMEDFVMEGEDMESHILDSEHEDPTNKLIFKVPSLTVSTLARKYNVPKHFAVLSIDAEGFGDVILHQWLDDGFRPAYIIYEVIHNQELLVETSSYLKSNDYRFMNKLGWNLIFEHDPLTVEE